MAVVSPLSSYSNIRRCCGMVAYATIALYLCLAYKTGGLRWQVACS